MKRWMKPSKKAIVTTVGTGDKSPDEQANVHQVAMDGLRVRVGRNRLGGEGEPPHHPRMTVAHFLAQVVHDLGAGLVRADRDVGAGHPVDEIALEHRRIAGDDSAALARRTAARDWGSEPRRSSIARSTCAWIDAVVRFCSPSRHRQLLVVIACSFGGQPASRSDAREQGRHPDERL